MIKIPIVCVIIQCLSHTAVPAAISEFTILSTKQALTKHLGASPAPSMGHHLSPVFQK